jgi:hypothetical protein
MTRITSNLVLVLSRIQHPPDYDFCGGQELRSGLTPEIVDHIRLEVLYKVTTTNFTYWGPLRLG